jgi:hypothetical protein
MSKLPTNHAKPNILWMFWAIFILTGVSFADTTWVRTPNVSGIWTADHSPYMVMTNITVQAGHTLQINPGVRVWVWADPWDQKYLTVRGKLLALGTEGDSIYFGNTTTNSWDWAGIHIVQTQDTSIFEYTEIKNANANSVDGTGATVGGGVYAYQASPIFRHCLFRSNKTWGPGSAGGAYFGRESSPTFENCDFLNNYANLAGGAVALVVTPSLTQTVFSQCLFRGNSTTFSTSEGGTIHFNSINAIFDHCTISGGSASDGGGLYQVWGNTQLNYCRISGNRIAGNVHSGGMLLWDVEATLNHCFIDSNSCGGIECYGASPTIKNCTIINNNCCGIYTDRYSGPRINSSVIAFNMGRGIEGYTNFINLNYSDLFGNTGGNFGGTPPALIGIPSITNTNNDSCDIFHNVLLDPKFCFNDTNYDILPRSPCINAGDPAMPHDQDSSIADIGANNFVPANFNPPAPFNLIHPSPSGSLLSLRSSHRKTDQNPP